MSGSLWSEKVARASIEPLNKKKSLGLLAAMLLVMAGSPGHPEGRVPPLFLSATLVKVVDGDTLKVLSDSGPLSVRLYGIDTPERQQDFGRAATKALAALVQGQSLELEPIQQRDGYRRMVARVFVEGEDINAQLVASGYAWAYRRYLHRTREDQRYCQLEANARAQGRGIWSGPTAAWEPPWIFRAKRRGRPVPERDYGEETEALCIGALGRPDSSLALKADPVRPSHPD